MNKKWNLYSISESRGVLMGIATIIVAFFHCYSYHFDKIISNDFIVKLLNYLRQMGNIGVDIFLVLSAVGLYFSFSKDSNTKRFYKKRILRVIPSIIIVASIYYLIKGVDILSFIKGVSLTAFYINGLRDFWYFALIIILYLLYPVLYKVIDKKDLKGLIGLLMISIGITVLMMYLLPSYYNKIEIALTRIPIFLIGIYTGKKVMAKKEIPEISMLIFLVLFIVCNVLLFCFKIRPYIYVRYIYCILGLSIVFLVAYLHSKIKSIKIDKILVYIGTYSMEVYLIFEKLCLEVRKIKSITITNNFIFYTIMFVITMVLSYLLKKLCDFIISKWRS